MSRPRLRTSAAAAGALLALAMSWAVASAHDVFTAGPYHIAIGWQFEPSSGTDTYVGEQNGIQVFVDAAAGGGQRGTPVSGLNADCARPELQVTVTVGNITSSPFCPEPVYDPDTGSGRLDEYDHSLIPTVVGTYTFHIFGAINGTPVDQTVTSGPSTFDSVADATAAQFPIAAPSVTEIAGKIDAVNRRAATAATTAADANAKASGALTISIVAIVVAVALSTVNLVIARRRRVT